MKKTLTVILALVMVLVLAGIPNTAMAQPGLIKCTVSYNGNGNTSGSPPGDTKYDWMTTATVQGYSNLQKTGYTIIGWKDDSGNIRQPGFTWTILLSTEFDAVWKANTYEITFDAGLHGKIGTSQTYKVNADYNTTPSAPTNVNADTGWRFTGWSPTVTTVTGPTTYTAQYVQQYKITFDAGTKGHFPEGQYRYVYKDINTTPADPRGDIILNTGYVFTGWDPATITPATAAKTYTALTDLRNYTVTFDAWDHGTIDGNRTKGVSVKHGATAAAPTVTPNTGYRFNHWQESINNITGNKTVHAIYDCLTTYYLVHGTIGGQRTLTVPAPDSDGDWDSTFDVYDVDVIDPDDIVPDAGYDFDEWSDWDFNHFDSFHTNEPESVTAEYDYTEYEITFKITAGKGTFAENGSDTITKMVPKRATPTAPAVNAATGWALAGWAPDIHAATSKQTYTAKFNPEYTVRFMDGSSLVTTRKVTLPDTTVGTLPAVPPVTGYTPDGWATSTGTPFYGTTTVNADITVYAQRHPNYIYTVTFMDGATTVGTRTVTSPDTHVSSLPNLPAPPSGQINEYWQYGGAQFTTSTTVSASITVTPKRHTAYVYTVTFKDGATEFTRTVTEPATTVSDVPTVPYVYGFTADGWKAEGASTFFSTTTPVTGSITVLAVRHPDYEYTVTFMDGTTTVDTRTVTSPATTVSSLPNLPAPPAGQINEYWQYGGAQFTTATTVSGSITVTPKRHTAYVYTVTFKDRTSESTRTVTEPATTVTPFPADPTNTGYNFGGWFTQPNGAGDRVTASTTITHSMDVYAYWANYSYKVTYMSKGSEYTNQMVNSPNVNVGALPAEPVNLGYKFGGWYTGVDGTGTEFKADTTLTGPITVFANWLNYSYTVNFDKTDGETEASPNSKTVATPDYNVGTLPAPPTRTGYNFGGWYTGRDGTGTEFKADTLVTDSIRVYAKWNTYSYTVDFDKTDGDTEASPNSKTVATPDINVGTLPTPPERSGYNFGGWYTGRDGAGTEFKADTTVTGSIRVYAKWNTYSYKVDYVSGGAPYGSKTVDSPAVNVGALPTQPTKTGYNFGGWFTGQNGTGTEFKADTTVTGPITVYAYWAPYSYTVTFNKNGGDTDATPATKTVASPSTNVGMLPAQPSRTGYEFQGWKTSGGTDFDASTTVSGNMTVFAQWKIKTFTVTFNPGLHGELDPNSPNGLVQTVEYNKNALPPVIDTDPGYRFLGWNVSYNNVTGDITITARYAIRTYTLTVNVQGNGTVTGIAGTYNYGTVIDLGDAGVTPANGYQFTEFRNADGDPVTSVTLYGNRTVTAVFTAVAVTPQGSPAASPAASPAGTPAPTQNIPENQVPQAGPGNQGQGSGFSLYWLFLIIGLPLIILAILLFIILGKRRKKEEEQAQ